MEESRSHEAWVALLAGLVWLAAGTSGGLVALLLALVPGVLLVATGAGELLWSEDRRMVQFCALGGALGVVLAVPGLFVLGFWTALLAGSYLLGSISWSYLIVRWHDGVDIRTVGSGNAGATNVLRVSGLWPALSALGLDVGKGLAAVVTATALDAPDPVTGGAALTVTLGHVLPVFHGFRGGKGVATALGALVGLSPLPAAVALLAFLGVTLTTRYVSLGSVMGVALFPPLTYVFGRLGWSGPTPPWLLGSSAAIAAVVVYKHHDNIRRLRGGDESKLGRGHHREEAT